MDKTWIKKASLFLVGQTITLFGSMLVQYAISWHITLVTKSGLMLMIVTLCGFLPQVLISLFAGVWADRFNRKVLILVADSCIALFTAILAIMFFMGYEELWLIFVISIIRSFGAGVQTPAVSAFLTDLVPSEKLMRVNGINGTIQSIMMLFTPLFAGGVYSFLGLKVIFLVDVITAVIGITLLLILKVEVSKIVSEDKNGIFTDMYLGINYVANTKWLKQFLGFYLFYALMFGPVVFLTPLMVARSFGDESWRLVTHEILFAVGSLTGGVLVTVLGYKVKNKVKLLIYSSIAFGFTTVIMGFSPNFLFYLGIMYFMGITIPFINTSSMTVLQTKVEPDFIGRIFGLVTIISSSAMPLSMVVFGPLSDIMKIELQLIITGILMIIICLVVFRYKDMLKAGEPLISNN